MTQQETPVGRRLAEVLTPAAILDRGKLKRNCRRMIERARSLKVTLRPHLKTLKCTDAVQYTIDPEHGGIAVSTLKEADYFSRIGISDICLAICLSPDKLERAAALTQVAPHFSFFTDSIEVARAAADYCSKHQATLNIWIEIDCGDHRTGLLPDDPAIHDIAKIIHDTPLLELQGVATHGGHSYAAGSIRGIQDVAEKERAAVTGVADALRKSGIEVPRVSAGSTPTALHAQRGDGLTEIRPGVYTAGDLFQVAIGSCSRDDIAISVLATVISHKKSHNQLVLDAGGLALSKDRSTAVTQKDMGYGLVTDVKGKAAFGDLIVEGVSQEHGEVRSNRPLPFDQLPVGTKVRVFPNHVCMTTAMYESYLVVDGNDVIEAIWPKATGW